MTLCVGTEQGKLSGQVCKQRDYSDILIDNAMPIVISELTFLGALISVCDNPNLVCCILAPTNPWYCHLWISSQCQGRSI